MGWRDDYTKEVSEDQWQNLCFLCVLPGLVISETICGIAKLVVSSVCDVQ